MTFKLFFIYHVCVCTLCVQEKSKMDKGARQKQNLHGYTSFLHVNTKRKYWQHFFTDTLSITSRNIFAYRLFQKIHSERHGRVH